MAQMGFFDLSDRYASLDAKKDPLVEIDAVVAWEEFRPPLERVWRKPDAERKSRAGRKPMDAVRMFKTLVLSTLYNLSDDQIEYQVRDWLSARTVSRPWAGGPGARRQDGLALSRGAGAGGHDGRAVQAIRRPSGAVGLHCAGRADSGCVHRSGAAQPQHPR